jgi:hypothetical protein
MKIINCLACDCSTAINAIIGILVDDKNNNLNLSKDVEYNHYFGGDDYDSDHYFGISIGNGDNVIEMSLDNLIKKIDKCKELLKGTNLKPFLIIYAKYDG